MVDLPDVPFRPADVAVSRRVLRRLERQGHVRHVLRGVLVRQGVADSVAVRLHALRLVVPPDAVVCGVTAAWLWGVDARPLSANPPPVAVEVAVPPGTTPVRRPGVTGVTLTMRPDDVTDVCGLRVTTCVRTALDLGRRLTPGHALGVLDDFVRQGHTTIEALRASSVDASGLRGVVQLRKLLWWVDGRSESVMESWTRYRVLAAGFPPPEVQWWVHGEDGRPRYRLDLAWPDCKVALEYDGEEFHSRAQAAHDASRRAWLTSQGWLVLVVGREHVLGRGVAVEQAVGEALGLAPRANIA